MFRTLQGWRVEVAPPFPSLAPLPALPEDQFCCFLGDIRAAGGQNHTPCGSPGLVPQCPVLSARQFQPQLHLEVLVEAANFKLIQFLSFFFQDHDFVNKFIYPSHMTLGLSARSQGRQTRV